MIIWLKHFLKLYFSKGLLFAAKFSILFIIISLFDPIICNMLNDNYMERGPTESTLKQNEVKICVAVHTLSLAGADSGRLCHAGPHKATAFSLDIHTG